jgi:prevent-host-death family protein
MKTEWLTTLRRHPARLIKKAKRKAAPILITKRGAPAAYLVPAPKFERMRRRIEVLENRLRGS